MLCLSFDTVAAAVVTNIFKAMTAVIACAAVFYRIEDDRIANLESCNPLAHLTDDSRGLMSNDQTRQTTAGGSIIAVDIAVANGAGLNIDLYFSSLGLRSWNIGILEFTYIG